MQDTSNVEIRSTDWRQAAREVVSGESSLFGRIVAYAQIRKEMDGNHQHELGERPLSELWSAHEQALIDWLTLPLSDQRDDLVHYLDGVRERRVTLAKLIEFGMAALPPERAQMETRLFRLNLEIIHASLMADAD